MAEKQLKNEMPSIDAWLEAVKHDQSALDEGMYLVHNGVVRQTPKAKVRQGIDDGTAVTGMIFGYDSAKADAAVAETLKMPGIFHARVWLNEGELVVGDNIMLVLVGGDIRPHVIDALQFLVGKLKNECVTEVEKRSTQ
ncbi:molybdopterin biosynthesis protein [Fusibacter paucivorans]|uniref:Molybdopterin biosynthesis protein n=1 Tax=Fusibacter paucivorans TaxID=76009 RepID=A0ABS5PV20_9FIRM|nr:molybdenum cofactor biosynthesis protein MoaE [Fusibacter paucivorans]MBS7527927.1 molybdopterin biosynthesis protein [Fusibacter paucivorans]